jgi:hypothetical protein
MTSFALSAGTYILTLQGLNPNGDANDSVTLYIYPQGDYSGNKANVYSRDHLGSSREMRKSNDTVVA